HLPGDGVQKVRLAEADRRVNVERIEPRSLAECRFSDLRCTCVRPAVGRSEDEAIERVARIERRALEAADARTPGRRDGSHEHRPTLAVVGMRAVARAASRFGSLCRLDLGTRGGVVARLAQGDLDLLRAFELGTAAA